jgi:hypothetical protein
MVNLVLAKLFFEYCLTAFKPTRVMSKKNKEKQYSEAELITLFGLTRRVGNDKHPLLAEWLQAEAQLSAAEQTIFDAIYADALENIEA